MRIYGLKLPTTKIIFKKTTYDVNNGGGNNYTPTSFNILSVIGKSDSCNLSSIDYSPSDIFFKPDGTKLFFCGTIHGRLRVMNLREIYEIDSGYFSNDSFLFTPQHYYPESIFFKSDGTKLYMVGNYNSPIFQYSLSSPWDITTTSYDSVNLNISSYETNPRCLIFSPDGLNLYFCGLSSTNIRRYTLSSPWDLSSATYHSSYDLASFDNQIISFDFKQDGTKMYVLGNNNNQKIREYNLSTPWDITTASYTSGQESMVLTRIDSLPHSFKIVDSGSKIYLIGQNYSTIYRLNVDTPYDIKKIFVDHFPYISLDNFVGGYYTLSGFNFSNDGKKLYLSADIKYFQIKLEIPWRISSSHYESELSVSSKDSSMKNMFFNSTGTIMLTIGSSNKKIYRYNLSTPWNILTATFVDDFSLSSYIPGSIYSFVVKSDGTKIFVTGGQYIYSFSLSTGWDLTTITYDGISYFASEVGATISGITINPTGNKMLITRQNLGNNNNIFEYTLNTPWNLSSVTFSNSISLKGTNFYHNSFAPTCISWDNSGKKLYVGGDTSKLLLELSSEMPTENFSISAQDNQINDVHFNDNGTKMYVLGQQNNSIFQYTLSTAWNVNTAIYDSKSFNFSSQDTMSSGIFFKFDGTKFYMVGDSNNKIYQYSLTTPWDISTAIYDNIFLNIGAQDTIPSKIIFNPSGTRMFILGKSSNYLYQYNLSTAWDLSTASYANKSFSVSFASDPVGFNFTNDGKTGIIISNTNNSLRFFDLNSAWELDTVFVTHYERVIITQSYNMRGLFFNNDGSIAFICDRTNNSVFSLKSNLDWSPKSFGALF